MPIANPYHRSDGLFSHIQCEHEDWQLFLVVVNNSPRRFKLVLYTKLLNVPPALRKIKSIRKIFCIYKGRK